MISLYKALCSYACMSARLSHRLTANPVSLSPVSCDSHRPRSPLMFLPLVTTFARYVRSNSSHEPARSLPHVIRITMATSLREQLVPSRHLPRSGATGGHRFRDSGAALV